MQNEEHGGKSMWYMAYKQNKCWNWLYTVMGNFGLVFLTSSTGEYSDSVYYWSNEHDRLYILLKTVMLRIRGSNIINNNNISNIGISLLQKASENRPNMHIPASMGSRLHYDTRIINMITNIGNIILAECF